MSAAAGSIRRGRPRGRRSAARLLRRASSCLAGRRLPHARRAARATSSSTGCRYVDADAASSTRPRPTRTIAGARPAILATIYLGILAARSSRCRSASATAIYLEEYANRDRWYNRLLEVNIQNLAAVPSIVYGILGLAFLVRGIGLGRVLLAGAHDPDAARPADGDHRRRARRSAPSRTRSARAPTRSARRSGRSSGARCSRPRSRASRPARSSRSRGRSARPRRCCSSARSRTSPSTRRSSAPSPRCPVQIYQWIGQPQEEFRPLAAAAIIVLLAILLTLNAFAIWLRNRYQKKVVTRGVRQNGRREREPRRAGRASSRRGRHATSSSTSTTSASRTAGNPALQERLARDLQELRHGVHRPVRLRQEHVHPLLQPHERPHPGRRGRGHDPLPRRGPLRPRRRPGRGAQADRHGLPEAEPVPEVDLRQRRLRAARARDDGRPRRARRAGAPAGGALGRGQGPAEGERAQPLRRPAAAALHRALPRRRARRDPDGRAGLGARPDRDDAHRGPDARAEARVHDRDRHAQHAAGGARRRHDRVLQRRRRGDEGQRTGILVEYDATSKIFTQPSDQRTEDYVTGRFG